MRNLARDPLTLAVTALIAALSWTTRELNHQKIPVPARATWVTSDDDTMYQLRRVDRAFREGLAGRDPYLSYPDGSAIPWPPYYTAVAWAWSAPGAPEAPEARRAWIERRVGSLPRACGVATSVLVALGAASLGGPAAGLVAGTSHALSPVSIATSRIGNGDHHAFVAMLAAAILLLVSRGGRAAELADAGRSARTGALAGALAGLALGAWVASTLFLLPIQLALGWLVIRHASRRIPGLPAFGLAFHAAALLVLLPAVIASPWKSEQPWSVVNLAWFQPAWLALGGLVFAPLLVLRRKSALRAFPGVVAGALVGLALLLLTGDVGPAAGIREGFAWLRRDDVFMSVVTESRGFFGASRSDPLVALGAGLFVLPFAWLACARSAFRRERFEMLPWAVALPVLAAQSARQARFADLLVLPMSVVVGWSIVAAWRAPVFLKLRLRVERLGRVGELLLGVVLLGLVGLANGGVVRHTWAARARDPNSPGLPVSAPNAAAREMAEWIRRCTPQPANYAVLAPWTWGHLIEWVADRPTVATNFGTFVGPEAFRDVARFFVAEDPRTADALLERRRVRYILVTSFLPDQLLQFIRAADPALRSRYVDDTAGRASLRAAWYRTVGARLLFDGGVPRGDGSVADALDFLRLVSASRESDRRATPSRRPVPLGLVWERVPGAVVEGRGAPGDTLTLRVAVRYPAARHELTWSRSAPADSTGVATLRVPYATEAPNGDGIASGPATWRLGARGGTLRIPEAAVLSGERVPLTAP